MTDAHTQAKTYTLSQLAEKVGGRVRGDGAIKIAHIASLEKALVGDITFIANERYLPLLERTQASAVILSQTLLPHYAGNAVLVADPYYAYATIATAFEYIRPVTLGMHPTAFVGDHVRLPKHFSIGPYCIIGQGVVIGEGSVIEAHSILEEGVELGARAHLHPRVTIRHHCVLGDDVILQSGVVIGSDGFGNAQDKQGQWLRIPQLGRVVIGDRVEIGANTTIDRGTIEDTIIATGVRLDNLIQIAHNVKIGENTAIAAAVAIAGSTTVGKNCLIGGQVGIAGHLQITDNVILTGKAMVTGSIRTPGVYSSGTGLMPNKVWRRNAVRFKQLDTLLKQRQRGEHE